jgi:alanyl-tRNA synthetase
MDSNEIRERFLKFFEQRGHKIIPSASLVPLNDPTTLFTGSGMQPMIPYLLGQPHPLGKRIADSQKCFRGVDIDEVGDNRHTTFFEMLGNWSLGDYFKNEQIEWMFEFLVDEIGIDPNKLYITTFIGDEKNNIPKDPKSAQIWKKLFLTKGIEAKEVDIGSEEDGYKNGMQGGRIFYYDVKKNWWSRAGIPDNMPSGEPGGPDSEMFYEFTEVEHDPKFGKYCHPNCDCGRFLEIGNNVFMEYIKNDDNTFSLLPQKNVDFGGGLERIATASINTADIFKIDIFKSIFNEIRNRYGNDWDYDLVDESKRKIMRIIADHLRSSVFLISDGILPSNTDQGYFVRRLLRRAIYKAYKLAPGFSNLYPLTETITDFYKVSYSDMYGKTKEIQNIIEAEEIKFMKTLADGEKKAKEFLSKGVISGRDAFILFTTYGFPFELTKEISSTLNISAQEYIKLNEEFDREFQKHQNLSRAGSEQKFKGGLANHNEKTIKLHTAHHLLLAGLQAVVGSEVKQRGSNITEERLRIDFLCDHKLTDEEKKKVEYWVNDKIDRKLSVVRREMSLDEAHKIGAEMEFGAKYADTVSVYFIEDKDGNAISKEFCGGPHVKNTAELDFSSRAELRDGGPFKIQKEEAVAQGIRRIKGILL